MQLVGKFLITFLEKGNKLQQTVRMFKFIVLIYLIGNCRSIILNSCEVANYLISYGFPEYQLGDWICIIKGESLFNTSALGRPEYDGIRDYGLFQVKKQLSNIYFHDLYD